MRQLTKLSYMQDTLISSLVEGCWSMLCFVWGCQAQYDCNILGKY